MQYRQVLIFPGTRSKIHGLVASGGEDGAVECFDMRKKSSVGRINIAAVTSEDYDQVSMYNVLPCQQVIY